MSKDQYFALSLLLGSGVLANFVVLRWFVDRPGFKLKRLIGKNYRVLDESEREMARHLMLAGQRSIFKGWPRPGVNDAQKRTLVRKAHDKLETVSSAVTPERLATLKAPVALQKPHTLTEHGDSRDDPFYWMRDDARTDPEVLGHLAAENAYCAAVLADTEPLQARLFAEMKGRIQEADESVPTRHGRYYYYTRTLEGRQYRVRCRRRVPDGAAPESEESTMDRSAAEEVLLDENREAAKHGFYVVGGFAVSLDDATLAYSEDTNGSEKYTIRVRDVASGRQLLSEPIRDTSGSVVWAADHRTLFYVRQDSKHRPYQVWRHLIGTPPSDDVKVFQEDDEAFWVGVGRSRDNALIYISCAASIENETRYIRADDPTADFKVILPRQTDVEYDVGHWHGSLVMVKRSAAAPNSEVVVAPLAAPTEQRVVLPHRPDVKLEDLVLAERHVAVFERANALPRCVVYAMPPERDTDKIELRDGETLAFDEPAYDLGAAGQGDFESDVLMLTYTSLTTPMTVLAHAMATGRRAVKKVQPVLGGFVREDYVTERLWAPAHDGVSVPVTLVYNRHVTRRDGSDALHLDVYGAYEMNNDPYFSANRVSLLDRGVVYAIGHVRGGGEMGRSWYEDGKFLAKKNTFADTVACAEHLVTQGWVRPERLTLEGRSAGGMTVGAVTNMRPDLFAGVVMGVPFVDCLTTMLDESIPLTIGEYDEWGNPHDEAFYRYMKEYSPIDNIERKAYPNILVTAGLHDPRVAYWEPAKFVAKLRLNKTDDNMLVFKCEMGAGHFSQSGRFDRLKELALDYAFILKCVGVHQ